MTLRADQENARGKKKIIASVAVGHVRLQIATVTRTSARSGLFVYKRCARTNGSDKFEFLDGVLRSTVKVFFKHFFLFYTFRTGRCVSRLP